MAEPKESDLLPIEMRPGAQGFTRWKGLWTEGDPGSVLPGYLLESWNTRFDGAIIRARPGRVKAFDIPFGGSGNSATDPAAIIAHHVAAPPRLLLVLDTSIGTTDPERPRFADFTYGASLIQTLPTLSTVGSSMLAALTCPPKWHDSKLFGAATNTDRSALIEISSTPNFDMIRGRTIYQFAAGETITALLSIPDGLLVATSNTGVGTIYLWADLEMTQEITGIDTIGCMLAHNGKAITASLSGTENFIRVRSTAGVWSTVAPSSGAIADASATAYSYNTLAVAGPYVFVASNTEYLLAYDDVAGTLSAVHTLTNTAGTITSVAQWLNQQCAFCWYDADTVANGIYVGRYETRDTASPGVDAVVNLTTADFSSVLLDNFDTHYPSALLAYKSRMYVRFQNGLLVSKANSLLKSGWQFINISGNPTMTGGLTVI